MKKYQKSLTLALLLLLTGSNEALAQEGKSTYDSYRGLVMAGYQGWFCAPGDGADRGWYHYTGHDGFHPGSCSIDLWPETSEYEKLYESPFVFDNGEKAMLPSSYDRETVDLHFKWMKQYGIDGVFMQRFVEELKRPLGRRHFNKVLANAMEAASNYGRAISVMYDLSGMRPADVSVVLADIDSLTKACHLKEREANRAYLWHNGKPLVAVWGAGFNDNRRYSLTDVEHLIDALRQRGFSVMIGVPTHWRRLEGDCLSDPLLHRIITKCDVVMPWFVGRYNEWSYDAFHQLISDDQQWADAHGIDYAPLCYPGFSWSNMHYPHLSTYIPRNKGRFFKKQLDYCIDKAGARMLYIAMFDEIDEGTAIMKCARRVPKAADGSTFVPMERGASGGYYMKLAGKASKRLKKINSK